MLATTRSGSLLTASVADSALKPVIKIAAVLLAVVVTSAAAQVSVPLPFTPVPLVFTPLAVLMCGLVLGARLGMAAQVAYLAAGVFGLPVFAPSVTLPPGAFRLVGPTGGYLMAYPLAALVTGYLAERGWDRRYVTSLAAMLIGLAIIFAGGVSWLSATVTHSLPLAITAGLTWFLLLDVLKVVAGATVLPLVWNYFPSTSKY